MLTVTVEGENKLLIMKKRTTKSHFIFKKRLRMSERDETSPANLSGTCLFSSQYSFSQKVARGLPEPFG